MEVGGELLGRGRRETGGAPQAPAPAIGRTARRRRLFFWLGLAGAAKTSASASAKASTIHVLALTVDHGLIAAGIVAAVGSVGFAGFMISTDNSHPLFGGVEHLMIFAQPIGGPHNRPDGESDYSPQRPVDYGATGSIDQSNSMGQRTGTAQRGAANGGATREALKDYVLSFSAQGGIMVRSPKGSFAAAPGTVLPEAGRILSIENRNGRWVVVTEKGTITQSFSYVDMRSLSAWLIRPN